MNALESPLTISSGGRRKHYPLEDTANQGLISRSGAPL